MKYNVIDAKTNEIINTLDASQVSNFILVDDLQIFMYGKRPCYLKKVPEAKGTWEGMQQILQEEHKSEQILSNLIFLNSYLRLAKRFLKMEEDKLGYMIENLQHSIDKSLEQLVDIFALLGEDYDDYEDKKEDARPFKDIPSDY